MTVAGAGTGGGERPWPWHRPSVQVLHPSPETRHMTVEEMATFKGDVSTLGYGNLTSLTVATAQIALSTLLSDVASFDV